MIKHSTYLLFLHDSGGRGGKKEARVNPYLDPIIRNGYIRIVEDAKQNISVLFVELTVL
jgi:hypothetical protein